MKNTTPKIFSSILALLLVTSLQAAEDSTSVNIGVTHTEYVTLTGSVVGASRTFAESDIKPIVVGQVGPKVSLGTLGLESNVPGNCAISFSTDNNFRLRHQDTNQRLASYRLFYENQRINRNNTELTRSCNNPESVLQISTARNYQTNVQTGVYEDKITIVVTTE